MATLLDLVGVETEEEEFSSPTSSRISMLAPSRVPIVRAPFAMNFILPVPEASLPAVEICSDRSVPGMHSWRPGSWARRPPWLVADVRIGVDHVADVVDQLDQDLAMA